MVAHGEVALRHHFCPLETGVKISTSPMTKVGLPSPSLLDREQSRCRTSRTHRHDYGQVAIGRTRWYLHIDLIHARGTRYHACETHRRRRSAD